MSAADFEHRNARFMRRLLKRWSTRLRIRWRKTRFCIRFRRVCQSFELMMNVFSIALVWIWRLPVLGRVHVRGGLVMRLSLRLVGILADHQFGVDESLHLDVLLHGIVLRKRGRSDLDIVLGLPSRAREPDHWLRVDARHCDQGVHRTTVRGPCGSE